MGKENTADCISSGFVQFDNCNSENGQQHIPAPGTHQVKCCTFSQSSIHFHSVALTHPGALGGKMLQLSCCDDIHHCKELGKFQHLSAGGLIANNNIQICEAGVGIQKSTNPLVVRGVECVLMYASAQPHIQENFVDPLCQPPVRRLPE
ncbi:LOW QUALITY PROTEIN: F-box only protein 10 [Eudromia elegans]